MGKEKTGAGAARNSILRGSMLLLAVLLLLAFPVPGTE